MMYKFIGLERKAFNQGLCWIEHDINFDREDEGEYIMCGVNAYVYKESPSNTWKHKLISEQEQDVKKRIAQLECYLQELDYLKKELEH